MEEQLLTVDDLQAISGIIEIACTRGAFQASEMSVIGHVYDKLATWLASQQIDSALPTPPEGENNVS